MNQMKLQEVMPVNRKAKDTFFKKVYETEERRKKLAAFLLGVEGETISVAYGNEKPDLEAVVHVYDFRMTLAEVLCYIEQNTMPERFQAYDSDVRDYALVANGI